MEINELQLASVEGKESIVTTFKLGLEFVVERVKSSSRLMRSNSSVTTVTNINFINVLSAKILSSQLILKALNPTSENKLQLLTFQSDVPPELLSTAQDFTKNLLRKSYTNGIKQNKRLLVLVNQFGGSGKAKSIWLQTIKPIFEAADCIIDQRYTGRAGTPENARQVAANISIQNYDVIVPIAGDGVAHEILNGLANRSDALEALLLPLSPIPGGSGNAISVNLFGPKEFGDLGYAALNVIKGRPMSMDIASISQGETIIYSFLSAATGLSADLDLGTEHLRYMGDLRFMVGYLHGILTKCSYPVEVSVNIIESRKQILVENYNSSRKSSHFVDSNRTLPPGSDLSMPALIYGNSTSPLPNASEIPQHSELIPDSLPGPGWHTIKTDVQYVWGGLLPYMSLDTLEFPLAGFNDGLIDLVIVPPLSRWESLAAIPGAETASFFPSPKFHYFKCDAFRFTPLAPTGYISIDGEKINYQPFQVENHAGLARVLSLTGRWMNNFKA